MKVFADTSGIFALLVGNDSMHRQARRAFADYSQHRAQLFTSSFVLVETTALLQRRIGLSAVRDLNTRILPLFDIIWTDKEWYARAVQRLFLEGRKDLSLVDCLSFEIMESYDISAAFTFDKHFDEFGFSTPP
jgi:predicted nucleic acid-binding protein